MAASLCCEGRRVFVCVPKPRDPRCCDHDVQTESLWASTSGGTKSGGRSVGPTAGSCRRPRHGRCAFEASGTCERPWPPCSSYDDKDSSACRLIISPPAMTTGLFTRLREAGADDSRCFGSRSSRHYLRWNSHNRHTRRNIGDHKGIRADDHIVAKGYTSQYPSADPDSDIAANFRAVDRVIAIAHGRQLHDREIRTDLLSSDRSAKTMMNKYAGAACLLREERQGLHRGTEQRQEMTKGSVAKIKNGSILRKKCHDPDK